MHAFYDELAPLYHLIFENWEASVAQQGRGWRRLSANIGGRARVRSTMLRSASARKRLDSWRSASG